MIVNRTLYVSWTHINRKYLVRIAGAISLLQIERTMPCLNKMARYSIYTYICRYLQLQVSKPMCWFLGLQEVPCNPNEYISLEYVINGIKPHSTPKLNKMAPKLIITKNVLSVKVKMNHGTPSMYKRLYIKNKAPIILGKSSIFFFTHYS